MWKAARHFRDNPFLHFVEASVFAVPFAPGTFDVIYSRGVLHHTVSTERAFRNMAALAKPGGTVYLWVYGMGSIRETLFRRVAYGLEAVVRPPLSGAPNSLPARAFLTAMGAGYVLFNAWRRSRNPAIQPLTLERGVHAARDRFTPRYAHRHEVPGGHGLVPAGGIRAHGNPGLEGDAAGGSRRFPAQRRRARHARTRSGRVKDGVPETGLVFISWAPFCSRSDSIAARLGGRSYMVYSPEYGSRYLDRCRSSTCRRRSRRCGSCSANDPVACS